MSFPGWRDWLFSLKAFFAAMLALYIAMMLSLPRPYWSMATVYIVSHPLTGATRSKAVYRIGGTLLGATAAVLIVPQLVNAPVLMCVVVALWTGILLSISMRDRSPRGYLFMLSAYTLPMIALPSLSNPQGVFDLALSRSEEILLGITCASVVSALIFPGKAAPVVGGMMGSWLNDARQWAVDVLQQNDPESSHPGRATRHKMASDILMLDQFIAHLAYDTTSFALVKNARELRGRMSMLLPILSSLTSTKNALLKLEDDLPATLVQQMHDIAEWMQLEKLDDVRKQGAQHQKQLALLKQEAAAGDSWQQLLIDHAIARLQSLVNLWLDCVTLRQLITEEHPTTTWKPAYRHWPVGGTARYFDYGMIAFSAGVASLSTFAACFLWSQSDWTDGGGAVIMGAVVACFFASLDEPVPMMMNFLYTSIIGIVLSTVLMYLVIPAAYTYEMVVGMLAIPFLIIGTLFTKPRFTMLAVMIAVNTATFMGLQGAYDTDFTAFFNGNVATIIGCVFAMVFTLIARPFGVELATYRLRRASWRDLARAASGRRLNDYGQLISRMLDRLGQMVPRLAASGSEHRLVVFNELRTGFSVLHLQREERHLDDVVRGPVQGVLDEVAGHYEKALSHRAHPKPAAVLREKIDNTLEALLQLPSRHNQTPVLATLNALVELRITLFPEAAAFSRAGKPESAPPGGPAT